jgi:hypothetical protein
MQLKKILSTVCGRQKVFILRAAFLASLSTVLQLPSENHPQIAGGFGRL